MPQRSVVVAATVGLHARPAALFAKAVTETGVPVRIAKEGKEPVDAGSVLGLMTLGAEHGDEVTLTADGDGADAALDRLVGLLSTDPGPG